MLTKKHKQLQRQWMMGKLNIVAAARRLGYKKGSLSKGVAKVKTLLTEMGIAVF